jgi:hypothetical protein
MSIELMGIAALNPSCTLRHLDRNQRRVLSRIWKEIKLR